MAKARSLDRTPQLGVGPYPLLVVLGALPIVALAVFAYLVSAGAVERLVHAGNDATATVTRA
ncbi:MAG: hypothetical protein ACOC8K_07655, partial [Gemmatimonadota bacterium]